MKSNQFAYVSAQMPLPSITQLQQRFAADSNVQQHIEQAGLKCHDCYAFGHSYAKTLEQWLNTFDDIASQLAPMGYDEKFQRLWRFYLAACIANFETQRTDVVQLEIGHA